MKQLATLLFIFGFPFSQAQTKNDFYHRAIASKDHNDYEMAIRQIDSALHLDPKNEDYLMLKADALYESKQYQDAFSNYSNIINLYPNDAIALNQRGLLLNTISEFEYAIQDFDKALTLHSIDSLKLSLYLNRGVAKINIRDFTGAYSDFISAYGIDSSDIGVLNNLATVCDEVGKGDQTLGYLYRIITIDSTFIGAYANIGFKYQETGDYKTAIRFYDKVLSLDPNEPLGYSNRSFNRYKLGELDSALSDANKAIELYPGNSYAIKNRALIYIALKKTDKACEDLQTALDYGFTKMYGDEAADLKSKYCHKE